MAVRRIDLDNQISSPEISLLRYENDDFLRGAREPVLGNLWKGWPIVAGVLIVAGAVAFVIVAVLLISDWMWGSPFASQVQGTIDNLKGSTIYYHYEVDSVRYDKQEATHSYSSSYENGNVPSPVLYLSFSHSESRLRFDVQPPDLLMIIMSLLFIAVFPLAGYLMLRGHRRLTQIRDEATHLIEGTIRMEFFGRRGMMSYTYTALSPVTGKGIGGVVQVGRLSPQFGRIQKGSTVAILYRDDKHHAIL